jgi:hypothetical protein
VKSVALRCIVVLAVLIVCAGQVEAQRRTSRPAARSTASGPRLGIHAGYNFDFDAALLGAQATFQLAPRFDLYPSFDFYFVEGTSTWALNFDVRYRPAVRSAVLYFGGGINYLRVSVDGIGGSSTNLNLLGGIQGRSGRTVPFGELRITVGDASNFQFVAGLSWRI